MNWRRHQWRGYEIVSVSTFRCGQGGCELALLNAAGLSRLKGRRHVGEHRSVLFD